MVRTARRKMPASWAGLTTTRADYDENEQQHQQPVVLTRRAMPTDWKDLTTGRVYHSSAPTANRQSSFRGQHNQMPSFRQSALRPDGARSSFRNKQPSARSLQVGTTIIVQVPSTGTGIMDEDFTEDPFAQDVEAGGGVEQYQEEYNPNNKNGNDTDGTVDDGSDKKEFPYIPNREYVSINDDVYSMFFLSRTGGSAFYYSAYIFALKIALYTFLALDVVDSMPLTAAEAGTSQMVLAAQFLMLPVAVAMQEDLMGTFFLVSNIKYCKSIQNDNPDATYWKYGFALIARAIDGFYSLGINFVVLVSATDILSLFLNFAALQFLQQIDNIALELAEHGYLTDRLEQVAELVKEAELPRRSDDNNLKVLDTVLFLSTLFVLMGLWCAFAFQS